MRLRRPATVTAPVVIRATEAFTPQFAGYRRHVAPLYSLVVATAPLPDAVREDLGLDSRIAFNDMRNLRIYAHPTVDGRLVFGGRGAPYHFRSKVSAEYDVAPRIHSKIIETMPSSSRPSPTSRSPTGGADRWAFPATGSPRSDRTRNRA